MTTKLYSSTKAAHSQRAGERKAVAAFWERAERYREQNLEAAKIILGDIGKYGGESAGLIIWARLTMRYEAEQKVAL
jgi:hypothetical protein